MKIVLCSNYLTHHQFPLCCELVKKSDGNFRFISTVPFSDDRKALGWSVYQNVDFEIKAYESTDEMEKAKLWCDESDVVIIGSAPMMLVEKRLKEKKLTFRYNERPFKEGVSLKQLPVIIYRILKYHKKYQKAPLYMLCASAYTAFDFSRFGCYKEKFFKWGYFTEIKSYDIKLLMNKKNGDVTTILWVARLIDLKHPEIAIRVAKKLKEEGYKFTLKLIGDGEMAGKLKENIIQMQLEECVHLLGAMEAKQVRSYMEKANIFLFTSDYNEGWGAVLGEAMNSGCAVVASHAIGAVPFLIENGVNGLIYENGNDQSLYRHIKNLLDDRELCQKIGEKAYLTMSSTWNASTAAERLIELSKYIIEEHSVDSSKYSNGPCTIADVIENGWYHDDNTYI